MSDNLNQLKPIETAPKGRYILLFGKSGYMDTPLRCEVGCWSKDKQRWNDHAGDAFTDGGDEPTHWMPLPDAPDAPEAEKPELFLFVWDKFSPDYTDGAIAIAETVEQAQKLINKSLRYEVKVYEWGPVQKFPVTEPIAFWVNGGA
jgi:hypothetical protein